MEELRGLYIISVASRLLDMHPQTLRKYERIGFIVPSRTMGMLRLYSAEDIARLRLIKHLVEEEGLNLAGVELALTLVAKLFRLQELLASTQDTKELMRGVEDAVSDMLQTIGMPTS